MMTRIPIIITLGLLPLLSFGGELDSADDSKLNFLLGELSIYREDFNSASNYFDKLLKKEKSPFLLERRIGLDIAKDRLKDSLGFALELVELEPENLIAWNTLALIYLERKDEQEAIKALNHSIKLFESKNEGDNGYFYILRNLQEYDDIEQQIRIFKGLSHLNPDQIFPLLIAGGMLIDDQRDQEAKELLRKAYKLDNSNPIIYSLMTHLYWREGKTDEALAILDTVFKEHKSVEIGTEYIKALAKDFRYEDALDIANQLNADEASKDVLFLEQKVILEYLLGNYDNAKQILMVLSRNEPDFVRVTTELFDISRDTRTFSELVSILPIIDSSEYAYHHLIHQAHLALIEETYPLFYGLFDELRARYPHMQEPLYFKQMVILDAEKQYGILKGMLAFVGPIFTDSSLLTYLEGVTALGLDDFSGMETIFLSRLVEDPEDAIALNAYGYSLLERSDKSRYQEGLDLILKANMLLPNQDFILDSIGWGYYKMGDYVQALKYLEKSYNQLKNPEVIAHYILILDKTKQLDKAKRIFNTYKKVYSKTMEYAWLVKQLSWIEDVSKTDDE